MKEKIEKFINESFSSEKQFNICHELYGHCLFEHLMDLTEMQMKLWDMPKATADNPLVVATRFHTKEIAMKVIKETLLENLDDIAKWRKNLYIQHIVLEKEFDYSVGDSIVKGADKNLLIPMHKVRIVLNNGDKIGQPFYIKTAYPSRNLDDTDACYDAIDEWNERKKAWKNRN